MTDRDSFYADVVVNPDVAIIVTNAVVTDSVAAIEVGVWVNGDGAAEYFVAKGDSRRDPRDKNDPEVAFKLALGRAIRQVGRDILSDGQTKVREHDHVARRQAEASKAAFKKRKKAAKKHQ